MSKALFIVFEGIDGAGTTTQCQLLTNNITTRNCPVVQTREPGGTPVAEKIRALVLEPGFTHMGYWTELMLYAASRAQHVHELIKPALNQGKHVVCDRFTASTLAYQGYGRGLDLEKVEQIAQIAEDGCQPDLTIFLDLPIEIALQRRKERGQNPDRMELEGIELQDRAALGYRKIASLVGEKALVIDAVDSPEAISRKIWSELVSRWSSFPKVERNHEQ